MSMDRRRPRPGPAPLAREPLFWAMLALALANSVVMWLLATGGTG
jgi:hypothetical protein